MADDSDFNAAPTADEPTGQAAAGDAAIEINTSSPDSPDSSNDEPVQRRRHRTDYPHPDATGDHHWMEVEDVEDALFDLSASEAEGEDMNLTDGSSDYGYEDDEDEDDEAEWASLRDGTKPKASEEEIAAIVRSYQVPARTFPKFMQLPTELRLKIWEMFCPDLFTLRCVLQVRLQNNGRLVAMPTLRPQMRPVRRLLSIHRETRVLALKRVPDEIHVGSSAHDKDTVARFNAQRDIIHITIEPREESLWRLESDLYAHVKHLALDDWERRTRPPGVYLDRVFGQSVFEMLTVDDASHQVPSELRGDQVSVMLARAFPNLERLYVTEPGSVRRVDRWVGDSKHQEYHIRMYEQTEMGRRIPLHYNYCWQEPKEKTDEEKEEEEEEKKREEEHEEEGDGGDQTADGETEGENRNKKEPDAVVNHVSILARRGVQHVRMLFFDLDEGRALYRDLKQMCGPDGAWPTDSDGRPVQDEPPFYDDYMEEEENEYESEGIDDADIEEPQTEDEEDEEDDLLVQPLSSDEDGNGDDDDDEHGETQPLAIANFSSPEPESEPESEPEQPKLRSKKRRIVSDSDDDVEIQCGFGLAAAAGAPVSKRRRRTVVVDDDDEDEGEDDKEEKQNKDEEKEEQGSDDVVEVAGPSKRRRVVRVAEDSSDSDSSHTEEGDLGRPLTLAERLHLGRLKNPIPVDDEDDEEDDEEGEEDDDHEERRHRGGLVDLYADEEESEDEEDFVEDDDEEDEAEEGEEDEFDDGDGDGSDD